MTQSYCGSGLPWSVEAAKRPAESGGRYPDFRSRPCGTRFASPARGPEDRPVNFVVFLQSSIRRSSGNAAMHQTIERLAASRPEPAPAKTSSALKIATPWVSYIIHHPVQSPETVLWASLSAWPPEGRGLCLTNFRECRKLVALVKNRFRLRNVFFAAPRCALRFLCGTQ